MRKTDAKKLTLTLALTGAAQDNEKADSNLMACQLHPMIFRYVNSWL